MYTIYVKFDCVPEKRAAFLQKMKDTGILAAIRAEDGCLLYDYFLSDEREDEILLLEKWTSKAHQQVHMTQPHMAALREFQDEYIRSATLGEIEIL